LYALQSNTKEAKASDIHNVFANMITTKKVKILHSESEAKSHIDNKIAKDSEAVAQALMPFAMIDLMCDEIMNLEQHMSGNQTQVKQISRAITKDKFSAFEYALYYIYTLERDNIIKKRERLDASQFLVIKTPTSRLKR
jgi:hypothetical protein